MECLFCKIVSGGIPCFKIYEDENVLAFLDIHPVNPGHTLVIPKKHYQDFLEIPEQEVGRIISVIKKIIPAVLAGVEAKGFNLNLNNGREAGQTIDHVHWHIVPRIENDGRSLWSGKDYNEGEAQQVMDSINGYLT
ncbi:MAG: HIT family protein [Patescibacteria group bacterium]